MSTAKPRTSALKSKLSEKIEAFRPRTQKLNKEFANLVVFGDQTLDLAKKILVPAAGLGQELQPLFWRFSKRGLE